MFGKGKEIKKLPNSTNILERVSELDIFEYYLGEIPVKAICSPLREDTKPSFSLFMSANHGKVFFKDFATGESGDCFLFVMRLFQFKSKSQTFLKIAADFNLHDLESDISLATSPTTKSAKLYRKVKKLKTNRSNFSVTKKAWSIKDRDYWGKKYFVTRKQLEYCNVFPISHFFMNGICLKAKDLAYAFVEEKDGRQTFKIYQPYADSEQKWYNNNDYSTWELWTQLPKLGNILIVTSSRKDAIVIKTLFSTDEITSCSLQSESVKPKEIVVNELKSRFKKIFVFYDNDNDKDDNPGRTAGAKISEATGFTQIEIPDKFGVKDPSDFIEKFGPKLLTRLILNLVNKNN